MTSGTRPTCPGRTCPIRPGAFSILASGLERAGFKVVARTAPWDRGYLVRADRGRAGQLKLVGWAGDFGDPSDFLGVLFSAPSRQFGFDDPQLFSLLQRAAREPGRAIRAALYQDANRRIMEFLPSVALVYTSQLLAFQSTVEGYISSPTSVEPFSIVSLLGE